MNALIARLEAKFTVKFPRLASRLMPYRMYLFYLFSGGTAAFVDIGLIVLFTELFGWWYLTSAIIAFCIAVVVSFTLQKFLTFRDFAVERSLVVRQSAVYFATALANLGLNTLLMLLFVERAGLHYVVSQFFAGGLVAISSFIVYRYLIFKPGRQATGPGQSATIPDMHQAWVIVANTVSIFFRSLVFLGPRAWLRFWLLFPEQHTVRVGNRTMNIRGERTAQKIVDLFMAASCILDEQYNRFSGFTISPNDTVVDIGGHIGSFSLYAAGKATQGRVLLFEPSRANFSIALKNIAQNGFENIHPHNQAVFGSNGALSFYEDDLNSAKNSLVRKTGTSYEVETLSLADIFKEKNIERCHFLKLDCEGSEYEILFKTPAEILCRIDRMAIEVHTPSYFGITDPHHTEENLIAFLTTQGFTVIRKNEDVMHNLLFVSRGQQ